ncbi:MAG: 50S ribosomal protein L6 [Clostridiaceae bacterium]|jgi:large subunit ribosomal protein L6|nr:50S ribosomal protein L6 [Clostridiaceae bacterium]
MSRIGKMPIKIPEGVSVNVEESTVTVTKGAETLVQVVHPDMTVTVEAGEVIVKRPDDSNKHKALHGLTRSLINNMVVGVSNGFSKNLEINGVGFKATKQGTKVVFNLGYSHIIEVEEPKGITIDVPAPNRIVVKGADKQLVGETAAKIRSLRVPDPYHGKGIKYDFEHLKLKEGKTGAKGA